MPTQHEGGGSALALIERRIMSGEPFTFGDLWQEANEAGGQPRMDTDSPNYRLADRTIQKYRRKGLIDWRKEDGKTVWRLTDAAISQSEGRS